MDYSVNKPIWPGSSSFNPGDTPFGFFDNDTLFQQHADSFAKHAAQTVGYPIMDVELIDINFYTAFESSVVEYSNQINQIKTKFGNYNNFSIEENINQFDSINKSDLLITDHSGISIEYILIFKKPVIFSPFS